jgi:hypothetical protein
MKPTGELNAGGRSPLPALQREVDEAGRYEDDPSGEEESGKASRPEPGAEQEKTPSESHQAKSDGVAHAKNICQMLRADLRTLPAKRAPSIIGRGVRRNEPISEPNHGAIPTRPITFLQNRAASHFPASSQTVMLPSE